MKNIYIYMIELFNDNINFYILQLLVLLYRSCMSYISLVNYPYVTFNHFQSGFQSFPTIHNSLQL